MTDPPRTRADRLADLVEEALARPPGEWADFLRDACGGDDALRAEAESLLRWQDEVGDFIATPLVPPASAWFADEETGAPATGSLPPGTRLGGCEIRALLGAGGMGEVYLADETALGRQVAVKVVRRGLLATEKLLRRFRHEERILAALNHPHIARLYGSGVTPEGVPYFVMEHVAGERLDEFCHRRGLPLPDRLALFRKVCAAVSYAHQRLVIHRDLKPGNILVTAEGEPKLLDFGIARLLDAEEDATAAATLTLGGGAMTPDYASPEQLRGEAMTTVSDVYALGVVLYELLTGRRPFQARAQPGGTGAITPRLPLDLLARAAATGQEPARPSTALLTHQRETPPSLPAASLTARALRGDLDNIVLKALRPEPARRYGSVAALSEDLRRHLDGLPVLARPDTLRYRAGKFIARNRALAAAAALLLCTLLAGIAATVWQARRATREAALATAQRDRAERRFADVRQLSNALLFDIAPKIERLEGATEARQALLAQSLKYLDSLAAEDQDDRALQSELAAAYEKIGDLQGNPTNPNLIEGAAALASYEKANAIRRALLEKAPADSAQRRALADNFRVLGDIRWQAGDAAGSLGSSQRALELYTAGLAARAGLRGAATGAGAHLARHRAHAFLQRQKSGRDPVFSKDHRRHGNAARPLPGSRRRVEPARQWPPPARQRPGLGGQAARSRNRNRPGRRARRSARRRPS